MPWLPTEGNANSLEQWIKDYYASSAFNVCEHQALQARTGPQLNIRVKEGAEPVAVHHQIPSLAIGARRCLTDWRRTADWG